MAGERARRHLWRVAAVTAAAAVAIVAVLAARGRQAPSADERELQAYRLSMPKVRQMNDAYAAFFKALQNDPQFKALHQAREELSALEHKEELTSADERRIAQLEAQIAKAEDAAGLDLGQEQSLSDMVRAIETQPRFAAAIKGAGLTPREFAKIQLALFQAMFAYGFIKAGTIKELPAEVPAENVAFVRQHEKELEAMARQWQGVAGRPEADDPESDEEIDEEVDGVD